MEGKSSAVELQQPIDNGWDSPKERDHGSGEGYQTGTSDDAIDMHRMGKKQEFKRNFRSFSVLGLSSVVMATWVAILG